MVGFLYALFFAVDLIAAAIAYRLDREDPRDLWWLFWQRFVYRQMMYAVLWKSVVMAIKGKRQGWGKLDRTGAVRVAGAAGRACGGERGALALSAPRHPPRSPCIERSPSPPAPH